MQGVGPMGDRFDAKEVRVSWRIDVRPARIGARRKDHGDLPVDPRRAVPARIGVIDEGDVSQRRALGPVDQSIGWRQTFGNLAFIRQPDSGRRQRQPRLGRAME